jgi:hypothetical protein
MSCSWVSSRHIRVKGKNKDKNNWGPGKAMWVVNCQNSLIHGKLHGHAIRNMGKHGWTNHRSIWPSHWEPRIHCHLPPALSGCHPLSLSLFCGWEFVRFVYLSIALTSGSSLHHSWTTCRKCSTVQLYNFIVFLVEYGFYTPRNKHRIWSQS